MKAKIIVEQFDNGISLKWSSNECDPVSIVAQEFDEERTLGKMIFEDIKQVMNKAMTNTVTLNIE